MYDIRKSLPEFELKQNELCLYIQQSPAAALTLLLPEFFWNIVKFLLTGSICLDLHRIIMLFAHEKSHQSVLFQLHTFWWDLENPLKECFYI